jgi:hypothetical protein
MDRLAFPNKLLDHLASIVSMRHGYPTWLLRNLTLNTSVPNPINPNADGESYHALFFLDNRLAVPTIVANQTEHMWRKTCVGSCASRSRGDNPGASRPRASWPAPPS